MVNKMIAIKFENLAWPKGLHLNILKDILSADDSTDFILKRSILDRKNRRIILPSWKTFVKVVCHFLWSLIEKEEATWDEVEKYIRDNFGTLEKFAVSKFQVKRLYRQREKEMKNGK